MNLILFKKGEIGQPLPSSDIRYQHIKNILKMGRGDSFDAGLINGWGGRAIIGEFTEDEMIVQFSPLWESPPLSPVTLIIGTPRPPTARRLLKDITSMGIDRIWFTATELGEKSYLTSKLWKDEKYMEYVLEGAQQGETTLLPEIRRFYSLKRCVEELGDDQLCALDNNESQGPISQFQAGADRTVIAIGPERGWTEKERQTLKNRGFAMLSMGQRVLRTETACSLATGFILGSKGLM